MSASIEESDRRVRPFLRVWIVWTTIWMLLLVVALLTSEGEPMCEGPLILWVDESFPPQCDSPVAALPTVGLALYALGFFPSMIIAAVVQARRNAALAR